MKSYDDFSLNWKSLLCNFVLGDESYYKERCLWRTPKGVVLGQAILKGVWSDFEHPKEEHSSSFHQIREMLEQFVIKDQQFLSHPPKELSYLIGFIKYEGGHEEFWERFNLKSGKITINRVMKRPDFLSDRPFKNAQRVKNHSDLLDSVKRSAPQLFNLERANYDHPGYWFADDFTKILIRYLADELKYHFYSKPGSTAE